MYIYVCVCVCVRFVTLRLYVAVCGVLGMYVTQASKIVFLENRHRMRILYWVLLVSTAVYVPLLIGLRVSCMEISEGEFRKCQHTTWFQVLQYYNILALFILGFSLIIVTCMLQQRMWKVLRPSQGGSSGGGGGGGSSGTVGQKAERKVVINNRDGIGKHSTSSNKIASLNSKEFANQLVEESNEEMRSNDEESDIHSRFWLALFRMNVVMICCTVSFIVRAILFARLIQISHMRPQNHIHQNIDLKWKWLMYQEWIPAAIPTFCLLYLMRDSKNAGPVAMKKANDDQNEFNRNRTHSSGWGSMDDMLESSPEIDDDDSSMEMSSAAASSNGQKKPMRSNQPGRL
jgi:hypothetical protein